MTAGESGSQPSQFNFGTHITFSESMTISFVFFTVIVVSFHQPLTADDNVNKKINIVM